MAKRGRKPKPETLKILDGTRADRRNANAPSGVQGVPECPEHLSARSRQEWDRLVVLLERMGVLSQTDGAALAIYCVIFDRWLKARAEMASNGLVLETDLGGVKPNPAVTIAAKCEDQMAKLLLEFGCTPSSRGRLDKLKGEAPKDELEEFLSTPKKRAR